MKNGTKAIGYTKKKDKNNHKKQKYKHTKKIKGSTINPMPHVILIRAAKQVANIL